MEIVIHLSGKKNYIVFIHSYFYFFGKARNNTVQKSA